MPTTAEPIELIKERIEQIDPRMEVPRQILEVKRSKGTVVRIKIQKRGHQEASSRRTA